MEVMANKIERDQLRKCFMEKDFKKCVTLAQELLEYGLHVNDRESKNLAYRFLFDSYYNLGNRRQYYKWGSKLVEQVNVEGGINRTYAYYALGVMLEEIDDYENMEQLNRELIRYYKVNYDERQLCGAYNNLAVSLIKQGRLDEARIEIDILEEYVKRLEGKVINLGLFFSILKISYHTKKKEFDIAKGIIDSYKNQMASLEQQYGCMYFYEACMIYCLESKDIDEAVAYARKGYELSCNFEDKRFQMIMLKSLCEHHEYLEKEEAIAYLGKHFELVNFEYEEKLGLEIIKIFNLYYRLIEIDKANFDELTKIRNRKYVWQYLSNVDMYDNISFIEIDVDDFKLVNDQYGHQNGDEVLKCLALIVEDTVGNYGIASRYGGDEFVVVLKNVDIGMACELGEKIVKNVKTTKVPGLDIHFTISIGVSDMAYHSEKDHKALLELADKGLYVAKGQGKNQVGIVEVDV